MLSPLIRLSQNQIMALVDADWLASDGPIRLNGSLSLKDLQGSLILNHARLVMQHLETSGGIKLTAGGNFNRKFVVQMVEEFEWPGYESEVIWKLNKVLNEEDFVPLNFLHGLLDVAGLVRKYKGTHRLSRLGRSFLSPDEAGELMVVLFDGLFQRYNLGYLDRWQVRDNFQAQIGLTLFLMSKFADKLSSPEDLVTTTIDPLEEHSGPFKPKHIFRWRVLRYLEWFGLMETMPAAANDEWGSHDLYLKTPLYDLFLSFHIEADIT